MADEALLPNAVEELLRFDPTAQFMIRATPGEYEVGGTTIPAGQHVLAWIASANRDERRWGPRLESSTSAGPTPITTSHSGQASIHAWGCGWPDSTWKKSCEA